MFDSTAAPRRRSVGVRLVVLALLTLLFGIPLLTVRSIVSERRSLRAEALASIYQSWGGSQTIAGPILVVERICVVEVEGQAPVDFPATFVQLPDRYQIDAKVEAEKLRRGLHETVVLRSRTTLSGTFPTYEPPVLGSNCTSTRVRRAALELGLSDPRAIDGIDDLEWNGRRLAWRSGTSLGGPWNAGVSAILPTDVDLDRLAGTTFSVQLRLRASEGLRVLPLGTKTQVSIASSWPSPSFQGAFLPTERSLGASGFTARWEIPGLARTFPERWGSAVPSGVTETAFGADWILTADSYLKTERALKYGLLFVGATFACLYFFELFARTALHPMQYLLVGAALIVFYLLLLSLSEHVGFAIAYGIATAATTALVTAYAASVLATWWRGAGLGAAIAGFYGALYALLRAEEHALLIGSIGLFAALALVMWATRKVDWSNPRLGASEV